MSDLGLGQASFIPEIPFFSWSFKAVLILETATVIRYQGSSFSLKRFWQLNLGSFCDE